MISFKHAQDAALSLTSAFPFDMTSEGATFWFAVGERLNRIAQGEPLSIGGTIPAPIGHTAQPRPSLPSPALLEAAERVLRLRRPTSFRALDHVDVVALDLLHKSVEKAKSEVDDPCREVPGL